jgi:hypothetical protein
MIHVIHSSFKVKRGPTYYVLQYDTPQFLFLFALVVSADDHLFLAKNSCILYGEEN